MSGAEQLKPSASLGGAPLVIVKGGTTTSGYDKHLQQQRLDAERRRARQDALYAARAAGPCFGQLIRLGSLSFVNETTPRLVLSYLNRDGTVRQQAVSEITFLPKDGSPAEWVMTFTMVCAKCVSRGVPQGEAQMCIRDDHRRFFLDERKRGVVTVEYAWGMRQTVFVAGTVTVNDRIKCNNVNCDYAVRIGDSKVYED